MLKAVIKDAQILNVTSKEAVSKAGKPYKKAFIQVLNGLGNSIVLTGFYDNEKSLEKFKIGETQDLEIDITGNGFKINYLVHIEDKEN